MGKSAPKLFSTRQPTAWRAVVMPTEVFDVEEFIRISERAKYCIVKRSGDIVKLKLRTPRRLYTLKVRPEEAGDIIRQLKCEIVEAP